MSSPAARLSSVRRPNAYRYLVPLLATFLLVGCGDGEGTPAESSPLADLQVVGVDFGLNSILLTNTGTDEVQTEDLHVCQEATCLELGIFFIEPRATILFQVDEVGGVEPASGEILLHVTDSLSPGSIIDYVAWGSDGHSQVDVAEEALLWNEADFVPTKADTLILTKIEPGISGSDAWEASSDLP